MLAVEVFEDGADLCSREHGRESAGHAGSDGAVESFELASEDLAVEKDEGGEGLVLGRCGDVSLGREVGEELDDLDGSELVGMSDTVVVDVAADPSDVGLLRSLAHVAPTEGGPDAIEESRAGGG